MSIDVAMQCVIPIERRNKASAFCLNCKYCWRHSILNAHPWLHIREWRSCPASVLSLFRTKCIWYIHVDCEWNIMHRAFLLLRRWSKWHVGKKMVDIQIKEERFMDNELCGWGYEFTYMLKSTVTECNIFIGFQCYSYLSRQPKLFWAREGASNVTLFYVIWNRMENLFDVISFGMRYNL